MRSVFRLCVALVCGIALFGAAARGDDAPDGAASAALASARSGDWAKAYSLAGQSKDPLALKLVRWLDYSRGTADNARFADITAFIDQNPDWPSQKKLRRRAELASAGADDDNVAAWFKRYPPTSGFGKIRAAEIAIKRGDVETGTAALRQAWIEGDLSPSDERGVIARDGGRLRAEDHQARLDRLLWEGQNDAAKRTLPLVSADYRALAEARLAVATDSSAAAKLIAKVPAALRKDPGLVFVQARQLRKKDKNEAAAALLLEISSSAHPAEYWEERLVLARRLMASANTELAYRLVTRDSPSDDDAYAEAQFLAGYIALRFHKEPGTAFDHFARILARTTNPDVKGRAAYWAGRAAANSGNTDLAMKWYAVGAEHRTTFYGQLSAHELGDDAPPKPMPEPRPTDTEKARFEAQEMVRAARLFLAAGDRNRALNFLMAMADQAKQPIELAMLAALAESYGRVDLAIAVARRAMETGMPLLVHGYPVTTVPGAGGTAERPLILAIVRQESAFATDAQSSVGARGLMQLMPATAAQVAKKLELPFSLPRLSSDGLYNMMLGRSYIEAMIDDFGGSYPLAIAAYNAGPGRIRQWVRDFGDPRGHDLTMVDWIEMIPFTETRIYVKRVLENLQVYRGQTGDNPSAFSLVADLAR
ncbi:MAG: transglycosylase SLT domain-containing protein [Alphaproteobacteria bacterium]